MFGVVCTEYCLQILIRNKHVYSDTTKILKIQLLITSVLCLSNWGFGSEARKLAKPSTYYIMEWNKESVYWYKIYFRIIKEIVACPFSYNSITQTQLSQWRQSFNEYLIRYIWLEHLLENHNFVIHESQRTFIPFFWKILYVW